MFVIVFFGQFMSPHHSNQMSQRSQISWVALFMSISKVPSVSESVSESVTRSPIELFWTAKNDRPASGGQGCSKSEKVADLSIIGHFDYKSSFRAKKNRKRTTTITTSKTKTLKKH